MTRCTWDHNLAGGQTQIAHEVALPTSYGLTRKHKLWSGCMLHPINGLTMIPDPQRPSFSVVLADSAHIKDSEAGRAAAQQTNGPNKEAAKVPVKTGSWESLLRGRPQRHPNTCEAGMPVIKKHHLNRFIAVLKRQINVGHSKCPYQRLSTRTPEMHCCDNHEPWLLAVSTDCNMHKRNRSQA